MKIKLLTPEQWSRNRESLLRLMPIWGSGRLTAAGLAALEKLQPADLAPRLLEGRIAPPLAAVAVVTADGKMTGAAFAREAGREACLVAVSPPLRSRGAGSLLLRRLQEPWGFLTCRVAADNIPSMKMCFRAGFAATSLYDGPTGKATLLFESSSPSAEVEAAAASEQQPAAESVSSAGSRFADSGADEAFSAYKPRRDGSGSPPSPLIQVPGEERRPQDAPRRDDSGPARTRHFNVIPQ